MDIFERAVRAKLRFNSNVGLLSAEDLFGLPLTARTAHGIDLDKLARAVHGELKSIEEGSFVDEKPDPRRTELELQLDILKHVIESKKDARVRAEKAAETAERKRRLLLALGTKEESELAGKTVEDLKAELAALDA